MVSSLILGGIVGFLLGLLLCYWNQISAIYEKRDLISSSSDLVSASQNFWDQLKKV